jgi:hypothetical protein
MRTMANDSAASQDVSNGVPAQKLEILMNTITMPEMAPDPIKRQYEDVDARRRREFVGWFVSALAAEDGNNSDQIRRRPRSTDVSTAGYALAIRAA